MKVLYTELINSTIGEMKSGQMGILQEELYPIYDGVQLRTLTGKYILRCRYGVITMPDGIVHSFDPNHPIRDKKVGVFPQGTIIILEE